MDTPEQYFSTWLAQHKKGELDAEIAVVLSDLACAVQKLGKAGSVTITLSIKPNPMSDSVIVVDDVKVKRPEPSRGAAFYYISDDGHLQRDDPAQNRFFDETVRSVDPDTGEVRRVGGDE